MTTTVPARVRSTERSGSAVLMVLTSCTSLQVGAACAAQLFTEVGSTGATFLRLLFAAVVLLVLVRPRVRGWDRAQWGRVVAFGVALAGMNGCFYAAIARIPLGTAVTIEFLGPLALAAVLSRRLRDLLWVALAAAGVGLLGLADGGAAGWNWVGVGFALVAGAFWALYILTSARVGAAVPGQSGLAVAVAVAALVLLPGAGGAGHAFTDLRLLVLAAATGLLASVVPYSLELTALRLLPPRVFGVLLSLEPAVATLAGWLLLHQGLGLLGAVAVGVVILSSAGSTLSARRPDDAPSPEPADPPDRARTDQHGAEESSVRPH